MMIKRQIKGNIKKQAISLINKEKLNIGSGEDYKEGWLNVDCRENVRSDLKLDLNKFPYPFKDSTFNEVFMSMIVEHLNEPIKCLKEIARISKNGAKIKVIVPHASSYANLTDIQHKTNFTENSFNPELLKEYELEELKLIKKRFLFPKNKWKRYIPFKKYLKIFFNGVYDDLLFEFLIKKT